jgi:tetratricopeptide (TPR) repeat protein
MHTAFSAIRPRNLGNEFGLILPKVEMAPTSFASVVDATLLPATRTRKTFGSGEEINGEAELFGIAIEGAGCHRPRRLKRECLRKKLIRVHTRQKPRSRPFQRQFAPFSTRNSEDPVIGLRVKVESRELVVSLEGVSTASLFIEDDVEKLSANIIVAGSVCFLAVGQVKAGLSLLSAAHSKSDLHQTSNIANHLARALMALEQYQLLANIARSLWTRKLSPYATEIFIFHSTFNFERMSPEQTSIALGCAVEYFRHNLKENSPKSGRLAYNIGEMLLLRGENRTAIFMFRRACELDPNYLTRPYLFLAAGGALYKSGRYKAAAWCYCRSLRLSESREPATMALLGDAQLHRGRIGSSVFWLNKALTNEALHQDPRAPIFFILLKAAQILRETGAQPRISRQRLRAEKMVHAEIVKNSNRILEVAMEAVSLDPINSYVWNAIAIEEGKEGSGLRSVVSHHLAAALSDNDPDYWLNFLLSGITAGIDSDTVGFWMSAAFVVGYHLLAEKALERLEKVEDERMKEFLERLSEDFAAMPIVERPRIMRTVFNSSVNPQADPES